MDRIQKICSYIDRSESFADVGCDHGFCAEYALKSGRCRSVIISDVSAKSLSKAEKLLEDYVRKGVCRAVCCDGLEGIPRDISQVLIAGMGGMEIIKILKNAFIPESFIFQPMKNAESLRRYLIEEGCKLTVDDIFRDDKFYFIIKGVRSGGTSGYTQCEYAFGRDSLNNPVLCDYALTERQKLNDYLARGVSPADRIKIEAKIKLFDEVIYR